MRALAVPVALVAFALLAPAPVLAADSHPQMVILANVYPYRAIPEPAVAALHAQYGRASAYGGPMSKLNFC